MSTDAVRAALAELVACHTEETGLTMSMVANRADFDAFMERCDQRLAAALDAARSALSAGDALRDGQAVPKTLDGMPARAPERYLRRLLAYRVGLLHAYYDDGEAHGTEYGISIDFMREPVADIDAKLRALNVARSLAAAPSPTIPAGQTRSQKLTAAGFTRRPSLWAREAREALELIAAPMRPDGTWNRDREACRQLAAEALGRSEDAPTPLTERIVYPKIPPRKIQDDDEQPAPQEPTP